MAPKEQSSREILAHNARQLMEYHKTTGPVVAKAAGVDRKTFNNILNARHDANTDTIDGIAKALKTTTSILLSPHFEVRKYAESDAVRLLELYAKSNDSGKLSIIQVAELAAQANRD